jgi:hypothetical protein
LAGVPNDAERSAAAFFAGARADNPADNPAFLARCGIT